jgi:hypothetical protein
MKQKSTAWTTVGYSLERSEPDWHALVHGSTVGGRPDGGEIMDHIAR